MDIVNQLQKISKNVLYIPGKFIFNILIVIIKQINYIVNYMKINLYTC